MTEFPTIAAMADKVGELLGLTDWMEITQERIDQFADATGDHQWIHVDPERAASESPFKSTIAHGFLVLSLASKFCYEAYRVEKASMGINYGLNKIRFTAPVPVGSRLRGRITLKSFKALPQGGRIALDVVIELEGNERPACVAEFIAFLYN